jgi:uncharacterized membrane protein YfcA
LDSAGFEIGAGLRHNSERYPPVSRYLKEVIMSEPWLALLVIGLFAGVMSGMFGIGGGIIIVPALTILVGFELQKATGTSLAALLLPVGLPAVIAYHRAGKLHLQPALWVAFGLLVGAFFGANIALGLDVKTLQKLYGVFVLVMSWRFVEPRKWLAERRAAATGVAKSAQNEPSSVVTCARAARRRSRVFGGGLHEGASGGGAHPTGRGRGHQRGVIRAGIQRRILCCCRVDFGICKIRGL